MNKQFILDLADAIENVDECPIGDVVEFDMHSFREPAKNHACGTRACIAGSALAFEGMDDAHTLNIPHVAQELMGLTGAEAVSLFYARWPAGLSYNATPAEAAAVLRGLAKGQLEPYYSYRGYPKWVLRCKS